VVINGIRRELSSQLGRAPRPSEIAQRLGGVITRRGGRGDARWAGIPSSSLEEIVGSAGGGT
jgi:hypothetical protein